MLREYQPSTTIKVMPHLQAVVRPLTGKNRQKLLTPQVKRIIALLPHDFSPLSRIKTPPV